jgi:D-threo-aldose 1-dehydrogenase
MIGGPYNSGVLATGPKPGAFYNYDPAPQHILDQVARIRGGLQSAQGAHGRRSLPVSARHPAVVSVIPGGQGVSEVEANLMAATADIPQALWADLKSRRPDA